MNHGGEEREREREREARHPSPCNTTERRPIKTGPVRGGGRRTIYWTRVDFWKKNVKSRYPKCTCCSLIMIYKIHCIELCAPNSKTYPELNAL